MSTKIKSKKGKKLKLVLANKKKSIKKDIVDNDSIDNDDIDDITINDDIKIETLVEIDDNDILRKNEEKEMELLKTDKFPFLYPNLNDSQFNIKIAEKKEFSDNKYDGSINDIENTPKKCVIQRLNFLHINYLYVISYHLILHTIRYYYIMV